MSARPIPEGYHSITPNLTVRGVDREIEFLKQAFGATVKERFTMPPDNTVMHAELQIGDSIVMLGEAKGDCQPTTAGLYLYVKDADTTYHCAVKAGGKTEMELGDQFWGDRGGSVIDPAGNRWWIVTHKEDVKGDELKRRAQQFMAQYGAEHKQAA